MNQLMLVGKLNYKTWIGNRLVAIINCRTQVGNGYEDIEVEVGINDEKLAKEFDKKFEVNSLVGVKGYIDYMRRIEVVQATNLTNAKLGE